jgi:hypothetical protein
LIVEDDPNDLELTLTALVDYNLSQALENRQRTLLDKRHRNAAAPQVRPIRQRSDERGK